MFRTLLAKEFREQWRTWKAVILLSIFLISGLISPVLAKYTPVLLRSIPGIPEALMAAIPEPTISDAIAQYIKNTSQFGILLIILLTMGVIAQEKERGTAAMLFTKPVRRSAVVLAKWITGVSVILVGLAIGGFGCLAYTAMLFEGLPLGTFIALNLLMAVYFTVYLSITLLASAVARSQSMAAVGAFGGLVVLLVLDSLPRIGDYTPGKLPGWGATLVLGGHTTAWAALGVSAVIIVAAVALACWQLEREEI